MKRLLLFMMVLLPLMMSAAEEVEIDGIYYLIEPEVKQAVVIAHPDSYSGDIVIPATITHQDVRYKVVALHQAFTGCKDLTSVVIPEGVTDLGDYAFFDCSSLTSITIPYGVTTIGESAFWCCSSLTSVSIPDGVTKIGGSAFMYCYNLTEIRCMATDVPTVSIGAFMEVYYSNITLYIPYESASKYAAAEAWTGFKRVIKYMKAPPIINLTAQEENGLVRLAFNTIPKDHGYYITRIDANGVKVKIEEQQGCYYPAKLEFVDIPPIGTFTYHLHLLYTFAKDDEREIESNGVVVTVVSSQEMAQNYGYIIGHIDCDKNPPIGGLKVEFSDGVTTAVAGTIFMRQRIPKGTELTMTVTGDVSHSYETATVTVEAGQNKVNIQGTWREKYEPNTNDYDIAYAYDFKVVEVDGEYHAQFSVTNPGDYPWEGYIYIEANKLMNNLQKTFSTKTVYRGKAYIEEITSRKTDFPRSYLTMDIVLEGLEPLEKDTKFQFNFKSYGKWKREGVIEYAKEKPLSLWGDDPHVHFPVETTVSKSIKYLTKWNDDSKEEFAYLMLALSSVTPGMEGMVGNLEPYKQKVLSLTSANDLFGYVTEVLEGKPVLTALTERDVVPILSAIKGVAYDDFVNKVHPMFLQKYWQNIVGKAADEVTAKVMLTGMNDLYTMVTEEVGTYYSAFEASMSCASVLYQMASLGNAVPLMSMMYSYQVVGKSLINAAKSYGVISNSRYILGRLLANKPYRGKEVGWTNTCVDFKLVVNRETITGRTKPIDFTDPDVRNQILDISIYAGTKKDDVAKFSFDRIYKKDCIILQSDGNGITGGNFFIDEQNEIVVLYMEISWRNGRKTYIPLRKETDGVSINENETIIVTDQFEDYAPLDYTVTLTTTTGSDNIADGLYLGSNKNKE